ncbi:MAG: hypothetical protein F6K54_04110 [Okeania sp. SIO3B5]|uniref:hypothetical protein n=1 Tax=Okeania sp. SIO3B5 TaxID=2607811 RepID=UPI0013FFA106|nr:hypothetical protein [Okeania sp. SIO3B5]NEO52332.1 hypothetical protein [Okeania sp. SIO3B5]
MNYKGKKIIPKDSGYQQIYREEQKIYNHFLELVLTESIEQIVERFRILFIQYSLYQIPEISTAMGRIIQFPECEEKFNAILNRCCYILINHQQLPQDKKNALKQLMNLFEQAIDKSESSCYEPDETKKMLELINCFTQSQEYLSLKRMVEVINLSSANNTNDPLKQPLKILNSHYPYLYKYLLINPKSSKEHQQAVRKMQVEKQQKYEIDLSHYVTHQVRLQLSPVKRSISATNPTLLSNDELLLSIKQFVGKVEGNETYRDYAKRFLAYTTVPQPYHLFKDSFYEYLSTSFDVESHRIQVKFKNKLYNYLQNLMPDSDEQLLNESLMMKTCHQLLIFLIVHGPKQPQHFFFINLIGNLGPVITTGLLLKILLVCQQVRPNLEKRFAFLFKHYEFSTQNKVQWLVKVLENMQIALSTNFGRIDLSFFLSR